MVQLKHGVLEVSRRDLVDVPTRSARIHETLVSELWLDFDDAVRGCSPDDIVEHITGVPLDASARVGDHGVVDRRHRDSLVEGHSSGSEQGWQCVATRYHHLPEAVSGVESVRECAAYAERNLVDMSFIFWMSLRCVAGGQPSHPWAPFVVRWVVFPFVTRLLGSRHDLVLASYGNSSSTGPACSAYILPAYTSDRAPASLTERLSLQRLAFNLSS